MEVPIGSQSLSYGVNHEFSRPILENIHKFNTYFGETLTGPETLSYRVPIVLTRYLKEVSIGPEDLSERVLIGYQGLPNRSTHGSDCLSHGGI